MADSERRTSDASIRPARRSGGAPLTCPTCGIRFEASRSPTPPFCSERCQMIDLGRWLNEEIGLPHEGNPDETDGERPDGNEGDADWADR